MPSKILPADLTRPGRRHTKRSPSGAESRLKQPGKDPAKHPWAGSPLPIMPRLERDILRHGSERRA